MTTEERRNIRRGLLDMGFSRNNATYDRGDGKYNEYWVHPQGEKIVLYFAPQTKPAILTSARFLGATEAQIHYGGHDDPHAAGVKSGVLYDVTNIEVHSWHTHIELVGFPGKKFNSVCFELLDPKVMVAARAEWRRNHETTSRG
jgi:hypothetical protein